MLETSGEKSLCTIHDVTCGLLALLFNFLLSLFQVAFELLPAQSFSSALELQQCYWREISHRLYQISVFCNVC